jgi:DNA-binding transcriptional ArsR family regulator
MAKERAGMGKRKHESHSRSATPNADSAKTSQLLVAFNHEMRRRILRLMADEQSIAPRDLSQRLGESLSNVSYHVRVLANCEAIKLVGTESASGSVRHFYRLSIQAGWARQLLGLDVNGGGGARVRNPDGNG